MSIIAFRDKTDLKPIEKFEVTGNLEDISKFLKNLEPLGGDDFCEDLREALK